MPEFILSIVCWIYTQAFSSAELNREGIFNSWVCPELNVCNSWVDPRLDPIESDKIPLHLLAVCSVWKRIGVNSEFHIPIPILWNWFLECPNSNSSSGIVASTPIPTQWNWGDSTGIPISKFPTLCSPLKRRKRQLETPSSLLFSNFFSFSKGYRAWEILKSESQWDPSYFIDS